MVKKNKIGIYLLPNILTTFGLFSGFFSIILAINGKYSQAALAIFIAILWDGLDGRVARFTNTESSFGAQYDSIADMLSFGAAPALLVYFWAFIDMGKIGWISAFIYVIAAALRLARFNTQTSTADKFYFQGLPSPAAAALVAGMVWAGETAEINGNNVFLLAWIIVVSVSILMVSNIRYYGFKEINLKDKISFKVLLAATLIIIIIIFKPSVFFFIFFFIYALSGLVITVIQIKKKRRLKK